MSCLKFLRNCLAVCAALLLALAALQPALAQDQSGIQIRITQVDNSQFPRVTVYVSITDASGQPVGVDPSLIQLFENGQPVTIDPGLVQASGTAQPADAGPLTTMLVVDVSGSMVNGGKLEAAKVAAKTYVSQMRPGDQAGLIVFNQEVKVVQPVTGDHPALDKAIDSLTTGGDTAMYDALVQASYLLQNTSGRKAIIVLTDGMDNSSTHTTDEVIASAGPGGLSISTIGLGDPAAQGTYFGLDESTLRMLADRAGGMFGMAKDVASLQALYQTYGELLQSEYRITYTSPSTLRDGVNRVLTASLAQAGSQPSPKASYNPGGVLPEVAGKSWLLFGGVLAGLVALVLVPSGIGLLAGVLKGKGSKPGRKKSRIKLK